MLFDWEVIAPMVVGSLLILSIAGVILLRPISKRLGDVLEAYAKEKDAGTTRELRQIRELFETMDRGATGLHREDAGLGLPGADP
jgi:hypothetical protein